MTRSEKRPITESACSGGGLLGFLFRGRLVFFLLFVVAVGALVAGEMSDFPRRGPARA